MNFDAMRNDGYADDQIVGMLQSNDLFKDAVNIPSLKEQGFNDTQIVDKLKADTTFNEEITKRKEAMTPTQETPNNEGDLVDNAAQPTEKQTFPSAPPAPTMPVEKGDKGFFDTLKTAGENVLQSIMGTAKEINRDVVKPIVAGVGNVIDATVPFVKKEDLGIEKLPSDVPSAYELTPRDRAVSDVVESAKILSNSQLILPQLFGDDKKNAEEAFTKISTALMNTNLADKVEMDDKNNLYIIKDGKEYKVEDGFFKTLPSMLDAYKNTIVGGAGGTVMGSALAASKALPTPQLKAAAIAGGALGTMAGSAIDMLQAGDKTGLEVEAQHFINKLSEEGSLSIIGDKAIDLLSQGAKPLIKDAKEFLTGDTRAYTQMKTDLQITDDYAQKSLNKLNEVLETPLEDTKQARMYAVALENPQGLSVLSEALKRNQTASNVMENEIVKRTDNVLRAMEENAIPAKDVVQFLKDASEQASQKYGAMKAILNDELQSVPVTIDRDAVSETIKGLADYAHDPQSKSSFLNFANFIKNNANYSEDINGLLELRQGINRFFGRYDVKDWVAPDNAKLKQLIGGVDEAIYKTIDSVDNPSDATALKQIFEDAKADFSAQKKAEASQFFQKIDADGLSDGQRVGRIVRGLGADDESAQYVLSRLTAPQREKLELTAINEVVQKELYGKAGGVKAIDYEDVVSKLKELEPNMQSKSAKEIIDFLGKMETFFAKDRELIGASRPIAKDEKNIATEVIGKMHMKTASMIFEFIQRKIPFSENAKRLDIYYRLGKYMEQSHNTKELMLKMYNDPLSDTADKAFFGKAISYINKGDDDALNTHFDTRPPHEPSGGNSGLLTQEQIDEIQKKVSKDAPSKEMSIDDVKAQIKKEVNAQYGPKDTPTPPAQNPTNETATLNDIAEATKEIPTDISHKGFIDQAGASFITKTLTGAGMGGSIEQDFDRDGEITAKDRAIGAALGIVSLHTLTSKPAYAKYKNFAEYAFRQLEDKAMQGDPIAKSVLGVNYMYVGAKASDVRAFSDISARNIMKEIDDSSAKFTLPTRSKEDVSFEMGIAKRSDADIKDFMELEGFKGTKEEYIDSKIKKGYEKAYDITQGKYTLDEVFSHDTLFEKYPELKDVKVSFFKDGKYNMKGNGSLHQGEIHIMLDTPEKMKTALMHEIQHWVQEKDGMPRGGSIDDFKSMADIFVESGGEKRLNELELKNENDLSGKEKWELVSLQRYRDAAFEELDKYHGNVSFEKYRNLWGEQQARATMYRQDMTPEQRAKESWQQTLERIEGSVPESIIKNGTGPNYMIDDSGIAEKLGIPQEVESFGRNFAQYKNDPKKAIEHLIEVKNGQVRGALYNPSLGEIDLVWGKVTNPATHSGYGLAHIIEKHGMETAKKLDDIIMGGTLKREKGNTAEIVNDKYMASIKLDWLGKPKRWVVSAFDIQPPRQTITDDAAK